MITWFRQLRDCTSGTAILETVIVFPLVLTLMIGVIEFGRAFQQYHTADKSLRSAVRYLARVPEPATCEGQWGRTRAVNLAVYGTTTPEEGADPLIPDWVPAQVTVTYGERPVECAAPPPETRLVVRMVAAVPIQVQMLAAINLSPVITIEVGHEERHIGG